MNALITGGAGFIGSHLAEALIARGERVRVLDDLSTGNLENLHALAVQPGFAFTRGSVTDPAIVESLVRDSDLVVHLAAGVGVEWVVRRPVQVIETNVLGTLHVLRAASAVGARVVLASTSEIYGKSERLPLREDSARLLGATDSPRWCYATSKAVGEDLAHAYGRTYGLRVTVVRPFNTIGPRQVGRYGMVVPRLVRQALEGERLTVYGDGRQRRSFCDVDDFVRGLVSLIEHPAADGQVFNLGSSHEISILELARLVLRLATGERDDDRIAFVPYERAYGPGFDDFRRRQPDLQKIRRWTGWEPRLTLERTVERTVAHARERVGALV